MRVLLISLIVAVLYIVIALAIGLRTRRFLSKSHIPGLDCKREAGCPYCARLAADREREIENNRAMDIAFARDCTHPYGYRCWHVSRRARMRDTWVWVDYTLRCEICGADEPG